MKTAYSNALKKQVTLDRKTGLGVDLLSIKYNVPKSTIFYWIKDVPLSLIAKERLTLNSALGREKGNKRRTFLRNKEIKLTKIKTEKEVRSLKLGSFQYKLMCSLLFWGEGAKNLSRLTFINSDEKMIRFFLHCFRKAFTIDEKKFRVVLHLHESQKISELSQYWRDVTGIPLTQFSKPYIKSHTGKTRNIFYKGCVSIRYYDGQIAKELYWLYTTLHQNVLGA